MLLEQVAPAKLALQLSAYGEPVDEIGEHILPLMTMCLFTALHPNSIGVRNIQFKQLRFDQST